MGYSATEPFHDPSADEFARFSTDTSEVICQALRIAQCALQLQIAWHAGSINSDAAMTTLECEISEALRLFVLSK
jgi:hypothetical protein